MFVFRTIDKYLNKITMYRLMVYVLAGLLAVAFIFALTGVLSISAGGLLASTAVLLIVSGSLNYICEKAFRTVANAESWLITALILACILPPSLSPARLGWIATAAIVAIVGKFIARRYGTVSLNPAAAGALVLSVFGLAPVTWWIGVPPMFLITLLAGLLVLRKVRRFELFIVFVVASAAIMLLVSSLQGQPSVEALRTLALSYPLLFLGMVMLTEPSTMPASRLNIALYGLIVGALFTSQLNFKFGLISLAATPHMALIIGNVFSAITTPKPSYRLKLKKLTRLAPDLYDVAFSSDKPVRFVPGQYMEWTLRSAYSAKKMDIRGNRRTFTIASSPTEPEVHLSVRTYEPSSTYKQDLIKMAPGEELVAGHVGGNFVMPYEQTKKLLFIAGGIGVTPFRSMIQYVVDSGQRRDIVLLYTAADADHFAFREMFDDAVKSGIKTYYFTDRLTDEIIKKSAPDYADREIFISGPNVMVDATKSLLKKAGATRIHTDHFSGY